MGPAVCSFGKWILGVVVLHVGFSQVVQSSDGTITSGYVDNDGIALYYETAGEGQTILFLHGFPLFSYMWEPQLIDLSDGFHTVAIDGRGFNLSDKPGNVDDYRLDVLISDVKAIADEMSPEQPVVLVGHDWGGALAWSFAKVYPKRVSHLIVVNAPPPELLRYLLVTDAQQRASSSYLHALMLPGAEAALAADDYAILRGLHSEITNSGATAGADLERYVEAWARPGALTGMLNWYRANLGASEVGTSSLASAIDSVTVKPPTTLVWGDRDPVFAPSVPAFIAEHGNHVRVEHIQEAEHTPSLEQSLAFNRLLRALLAGSPATDGTD